MLLELLLGWSFKREIEKLKRRFLTKATNERNLLKENITNYSRQLALFYTRP